MLRSTDEILVLLEDMGLNLQSMMASPFVRPFSSEVRGWEQKLSLIGTYQTSHFSHTHTHTHTTQKPCTAPRAF